MWTIRPITLDDAANFLALCQRLDRETRFMLLEPDERQLTVAEQRARIQTILPRANHTILVAEHAGQLVGYVLLQGGDFRRNCHTAHLVIGILQAFTGQGLGARLLAEAEQWARQRAIHRLELTVMTHNTRAVSLYQKCGFVIEGTRRHALMVDGAYVDEYYMGKLLE